MSHAFKRLRVAVVKEAAGRIRQKRSCRTSGSPGLFGPPTSPLSPRLPRLSCPCFSVGLSFIYPSVRPSSNWVDGVCNIPLSHHCESGRGSLGRGGGHWSSLRDPSLAPPATPLSRTMRGGRQWPSPQPHASVRGALCEGLCERVASGLPHATPLSRTTMRQPLPVLLTPASRTMVHAALLLAPVFLGLDPACVYRASYQIPRPTSLAARNGFHRLRGIRCPPLATRSQAAPPMQQDAEIVSVGLHQPASTPCRAKNKPAGAINMRTRTPRRYKPTTWPDLGRNRLV